MPRPKKERLVLHPPLYKSFKPAGVRKKELESVSLSLDEFEALRLADLRQLDHSQAAELMRISRPTFTRLITLARHKIADFIIRGKHLSIEGGTIHFSKNLFKCNQCGYIFNSDLSKLLKNCPRCNSDDITNLIEDLGHGECCRNYQENADEE